MKGLLLVNIGSPASPHRKDVREFIEGMLSDPQVMTVPDWFRPILVKGIIGPFRQFASARHYSLIWGNENAPSPLVQNMKALAEKLEARLSISVEIAMRYGQPDISSALDRLSAREKRLHEVVVMPMLPQYAQSSYQTVVDEIGRSFYKNPHPFRLRIIEAYFNHPAYISALARSLAPFAGTNCERLIFCFHSLPLSHVEKGWRKGKEFDYMYQLKETARLVSKALNIPANKYRIAYSSAIGRNWLSPSIEETLESMAEEGIRNVVVMMPGFACDNLETLYDICIKAKAAFIKSGGTELSYVNCLNSEDHWAEAIAKIIS